MSYNRGSFCHYFVNEEAIEKELKEHNVMHSNAHTLEYSSFKSQEIIESQLCERKTLNGTNSTVHQNTITATAS